MHKILVIDDEAAIRESFSLILEDRYEVLLAATGEAALKLAADQKIDMAFLDIRMPGMDGIETLRRLKGIDPDLEIIMVTAVNDVQKASQAVRLGARDYVVKPFNVEEILKLADQILKKKGILQEAEQAQKKAGQKSPALIGQTEKILEIGRTIDNLKSDTRTLILGEPGTEKETVAQLIHGKSDRRDAPFITVNLARLAARTAIKYLLFGKGKGGSIIDLEGRSGALEDAKNGTVFLNNLEALPADIFQSLASLEFSRGEDSLAKIKIEARLLAGSGPEIPESSKDIFDFFAGTTIVVPPLRDRGSDLPLLISHYLGIFNTQYGKETKLAPAGLEALTNYSWPGNTRQLELVIMNLVLLADTDKIELTALPLEIILHTVSGAGSNAVANFESEYIKRIFAVCGQEKDKTAAFLGVSLNFLETKLT